MLNLRNIGLYYRERNIFIFFTGGMLCSILGIIWVILAERLQTGQIALHYNIFFGIDLVGPWYQLLKYPLLSGLVLLINFALGNALFTHDKYLSYYLGFVSMLCSISTLIYLIAIRRYIF